jgi:hypothetical protein
MSSAATQIDNVVSKIKEYDVTFTPAEGEAMVLEYTSWMLPGRSEASSYNLVTNLRNIEESAGDRNTKYPHSWCSYVNRAV